MRSFYCVFSAIGLLFVVKLCRGKIFGPCELAQELHRIIDAKYLYKEIPLLVCVAGYQNYDTQFYSKRPDGSYYAGIFGIHSSTIKWMARYKGNLTDEDVFDDLTIFSNHVLQLDGTQRDDTVYDYFWRTCSSKDVERLRCTLNPYVKDFVVFNPNRKTPSSRPKGVRNKNTFD